MYWAGWRGEEIRRANLDGSGDETIITGVARVYDLAIDEGGGKIYYAGWDGILRANLDGSQVETFFPGSFKGVALDLDGGKIYWTDWIEGDIQRGNFDGSQVETIVSGLDEPHDIALGP